MSAESIEKKSYWIFVVCVIALANVCIAIQTQFQSLDNLLFYQLFSIGRPPQTIVASVLPLIVFTTIECVVSASIGYRLAALPRTFALVQLYVISLLAQWLLYTTSGFLGHPCSSAISVGLGGLLGYVFRRFKLKEERYQSQFYELKVRNRELQQTRIQLVKQDEVERRMLAADLHDQVLNDLKALKDRFDDYSKAPSAELTEQINELIRKSMSEVREVMDNLCPSALEHLGLAAAIEDCCRRGGERASFKIRFKNAVDDDVFEALSIVQKSLVYRLVQEAITNICKHAGAKTVRANLSVEDGKLIIVIADDGVGIAKEKSKIESRGLRYMRQRADLIGATVVWRSGEEDKGTIVEIILELANKNGDANIDS